MPAVVRSLESKSLLAIPRLHGFCEPQGGYFGGAQLAPIRIILCDLALACFVWLRHGNGVWLLRVSLRDQGWERMTSRVKKKLLRVRVCFVLCDRQSNQLSSWVPGRCVVSPKRLQDQHLPREAVIFFAKIP